MTISKSVFKQIRSFLRLTGSYILANWKLFIFSFVLGGIIIYLWPYFQLKISERRPETIGLVGNYTLSTLPPVIQRELSYGLTSLDEKGLSTPAAAVRWTTENEGKSITFHLKNDLFWQDGTKFDTSQINYNLKGVEVKRLSLYQIQFNFKDPFSPLITIASQPLLKNGLIGLKPVKVDGLKFNGRFLQTLILKDLTHNRLTVYKFYPNEKMAVLALKLGEITKVSGVKQTYGLHTDPRFNASAQIEGSTLAILFFNMNKSRLSEKSFRQALAYALPDNFEEGEEAFTSLPKNNWAISETAKRYPQNVDLAKRLINNIASRSGQIILNLSSPQDLHSVALKITEAWQQVGLKVDPSISDYPSLSFDAHLAFLDLPVDPDQYALWHSTQKGNIPGYKSFKVDHLLEDGRKTFDLKERQEIYAALEKALTEDVPAIFLYYPTTYAITQTP